MQLGFLEELIINDTPHIPSVYVSFNFHISLAVCILANIT